jgi:transmembrane sensor
MELQDWLKDPAQRKHIMEMARWHGPDVISVLSMLYPDSPELQSPRARRGVVSITLAACAAALLVGMATIAMTGHTPWTFFHHSHQTLDVATRTYETGVGERRVITLPDNSAVTLNTQTRISVAYSLNTRSIYVASGEASFDVAPKADWPFNVNVGRRSFSATDAKFNVRMLTSDDVELTVAQGAVTVLDAPRSLPDTPAKRRAYLIYATYGETTLNAFQTALVEPSYQSVYTLDPGEVDARLAWQRGLLIFKGALLEDVLAEMDRYTTTRFVLASKALGTIRIEGDFRAGDIDGLLLALRKNFAIDSQRIGPNRIVLTPATKPTALCPRSRCVAPAGAPEPRNLTHQA